MSTAVSAASATARVKPTAGFSFMQAPGRTWILFDGDPILKFTDEHAFFRCFQMGSAKFRPHGPVELINMHATAMLCQNLLRATIACEHTGPASVRVTLTPSKVDKGLDELVREQRQIDIRLDEATGRFVYNIKATIEFLKDIAGKEPLAITPMAQWPGDDYAIIEFDDPLLAGGVGPQVPMTQDWEGLQEPVLAEDTFKTTWTKRFDLVGLHTSLRGPRRLVFNRVVNGVQQFYNRHVLKGEPRRPFYYQRTAGEPATWLRMTPQFEHPVGHHICEWGYDMHWYALLPKASPERLFARGQRVELAYQLDEIDADQVPVEIREAPLAEIEPAERAAADRPIYQEPACQFTASTLDCPDSYGWTSSDAARCSWKRSGSRVPSHGALVIDHGRESESSAWRFNFFGPSYGCNPIPTRARYRLTAWVKADQLERVRLGLLIQSYLGPACAAPRQEIALVSDRLNVLQQQGAWAEVEFIAGPTGAYNIWGCIVFRYEGSGTAELTELSVRRL